MNPFESDRRLPSNFRGFNVRLTARPEAPAHLPSRPSWACGTCGDEWPCVATRERLMREHESSPASIAILMWGRMEEFAFDQGSGPMPQAFDRFLRWTRR